MRLAPVAAAAPVVPARVDCMSVAPATSASDSSKGELPKSKPSGRMPSTSPTHSEPAPRSLSSQRLGDLGDKDDLLSALENATAAVVYALNTSMITAVPRAARAPSRRL